MRNQRKKLQNMNTQDTHQAASQVAEMARSSFLEAMNLGYTERAQQSSLLSGELDGDLQRAYLEERMRFQQLQDRLGDLYRCNQLSDTYPDSLSLQEYERNSLSLSPKSDAALRAIERNKLDLSLISVSNSQTYTSPSPSLDKFSKKEKREKADRIYKAIEKALIDWREEYINEPEFISLSLEDYYLLMEFKNEIPTLEKEKGFKLFGIYFNFNRMIPTKQFIIHAAKKYSVD